MFITLAGAILPECSVKPTMSLKKTVTLSNDLGSTCDTKQVSLQSQKEARAGTLLMAGSLIREPHGPHLLAFLECSGHIRRQHAVHKVSVLALRLCPLNCSE